MDNLERRKTPRGTVVCYGVDIIVDRKTGRKNAFVTPIRQGDELMEALYRDSDARDSFTIYDKKWEAKLEADNINKGEIERFKKNRAI